jgi:hypothetical protein
MALSITANVDQKTLDDFRKVMMRLQAETPRDSEQSIIYAALKAAESGRRIAKLGKSKHQSVDNPEWKQARGSFAWARRQRRQGKEIPADAQRAMNELNMIAPYLIVKLRQRGPAFHLPSYDKKDPRRQIDNRGLAKRQWSYLVGQLGSLKSSPTASFHRRKAYARIMKYEEDRGGSAASYVIRLINKTVYSETAYPGITGEAIRAATKGLNHNLNERIARTAAKANKGSSK